MAQFPKNISLIKKGGARRKKRASNILANIIASLKENDYPVKEILTGAYWTAVVCRGCGLASNLRDESHPHVKGVKKGATFREIRGIRRVTMMKK